MCSDIKFIREIFLTATLAVSVAGNLTEMTIGVTAKLQFNCVVIFIAFITI